MAQLVRELTPRGAVAPVGDAPVRDAARRRRDDLDEDVTHPDDEVGDGGVGAFRVRRTPSARRGTGQPSSRGRSPRHERTADRGRVRNSTREIGCGGHRPRRTVVACRTVS